MIEVDSPKSRQKKISTKTALKEQKKPLKGAENTATQRLNVLLGPA